MKTDGDNEDMMVMKTDGDLKADGDMTTDAAIVDSGHSKTAGFQVDGYRHPL
jgi:hypothetical protein